MNQEDSKKAANDKWIFDKAVRMLFLFGERILLFAIASLALLAATIEILGFVDTRSVNLADLLLLFIYLEVIGMAAAYYSSHEVPIKLPIFIYSKLYSTCSLVFDCFCSFDSCHAHLLS